ncbi:MAG: hypothetical protein AB1Y26_02385 [Cycloclasticus sp.]
MISNLTQAQNYTQPTTTQQLVNSTSAPAEGNGASKENSFGTTLTLTEKGKAAAESKAPEKAAPSAIAEMVTAKGNINIDLDSYFSNSPPTAGFFNINDLPPLLMPSEQNINALTEHVSERFKQLLKDYNIPSAPEKITFDNEGKMQIPIDYPYANELNDALEENTGIDRELRTLNALSSHAAAIQERMPFIEEMGKASSKVETDRIIAKYSHLLHDNQSYKSMALIFSDQGDVSVTADGKPIKFT